MRRRGAGLFIAGALAGFALGVASKSLAGSSEPALDRTEVVLARGEGAGEPVKTIEAPSRAEVRESRSLAEPSRLGGAGTFREIARTAAAITVSIAGDGSYGAGFVVDDRHVITCFHVVEKMKTIELSLAGGPWLTAKLVDHDSGLDLALLSADLGDAAAPAALASATDSEMGDPVFSMGTPRKLGFSLASGIVSFAGRRYDDLFYLQTDVPTNPGSSGGPVLNAEGQVIGVSSFILRDSQGLAFALPIDYAVRRFQKHLGVRLDEQRFEAWLGERAAAGSAKPAAATASR